MTNLSNRQYPMLKTFAEADPGYHMPIEEAQRYDQRPFRSMLYRRWITFHPRRGFHVTREGRDAWRIFFHTAIWRKDPTLPLTAYFDPTAYALKNHHRKGAAA
jgi:hypothetical protein